MAARSLADRVTALEVKVGSKTIAEEFREQAELIDKLFLYRFDENGKRWSVRFRGVERDVDTLKTDVSALKADVSALKRDMVIVREGIGILLKKHG